MNDTSPIVESLLLVPEIAIKTTIIFTYIYWRITTKYIYKYATENNYLDSYDEAHAIKNVHKWKLYRTAYSLFMIPLFYFWAQEAAIILISITN